MPVIRGCDSASAQRNVAVAAAPSELRVNRPKVILILLEFVVKCFKAYAECGGGTRLIAMEMFKSRGDQASFCMINRGSHLEPESSRGIPPL